MRLTDQEVAARLAAHPEHDVCVLRMENGDYGCEEIPDPPRLCLLVQAADGQKFSMELPEPRVAAMGLAEGGTCCLRDLRMP